MEIFHRPWRSNNLKTMNGSQKVFTVHPHGKPAVKSNRNLHKSLKWVLVLAQCFGQMPVTGISQADARFLKFKWKSWRCFYSILTLIGSAFLTVIYMYAYLGTKSGLTILNANAIAFHVSNMVITLLFLKLSMEWPQLMLKWHSVEVAMRSYGWPPHVHTRISLTTAVMMSLAAIETSMAKLNRLLLGIKYKCKNRALLDFYLMEDIFSNLSYSLGMGLLLHTVNFLMTFAWTFNDVFIMVMSTALAMRLQQVTARLRVLKNCKTVNIDVWREIREDYNRLSQLARSLDNSLSYIVLISFASNLLFILLQLFNSLRPMEDTLQKLYFFFSFGLLILRTICVSLYGAWIYDESKEPLAVLNSVPSEMYNIEIKRFIDQIKFDKVALTGKNFFYVTRGLILSMAGAIVTYELVLIQFNGNLLHNKVITNNHSREIC